MTGDGTDVEALRQEIEQTRTDLGETVEALAAKVDVKSRAGDAASTVVYEAGRVRERVLASPSRIAAVAGVVVAGLVVLAAVRWHRRRS